MSDINDMNDIEWLAERINDWLKIGPVAVEMFRGGYWIERADLINGMLAIYSRKDDIKPAYLIPPGTPVILRLG